MCWGPQEGNLGIGLFTPPQLCTCRVLSVLCKDTWELHGSGVTAEMHAQRDLLSLQGCSGECQQPCDSPAKEPGWWRGAGRALLEMAAGYRVKQVNYQVPQQRAGGCISNLRSPSELRGSGMGQLCGMVHGGRQSCSSG